MDWKAALRRPGSRPFTSYACVTEDPWAMAVSGLTLVHSLSTKMGKIGTTHRVTEKMEGMSGLLILHRQYGLCPVWRHVGHVRSDGLQGKPPCSGSARFLWSRQGAGGCFQWR